ncbi:MAG: DUF4294 domain-containing protein [Nonlabens sp.]
MNYRFLVYGMVFWGLAFAKAQQLPTPQPQDSLENVVKEYFYIDGDSVSAIELDDVLLLQRLKFSSKYERIRYLILQRKVIKVWPYAKLASERLVILDQRLEKLRTKNQKNKYSRTVEKYIEKEFTAELKKFSRTEGQILIKLIHRQTGDTAYNLLRRLRSGWSAFWFDKTARIFDLSLKEIYQPETVVEDFYIEDILLNAFIDEKLEEQEPASTSNYYKAKDNWKFFEQNLPADYDSINIAQRAQRIKKYREKKARKAKRKARRSKKD